MRKILSFCVFLMCPGLVAAQLATATASTTPIYQVPNTFLGLSLEWDGPSLGPRAQALMGTTAGGVDTIFRQLVTNLALPGEVPFRIGGDSTDTFTTPDDVTAFSQFYTAMGSTFSLGIGLKTATLSQAETMASTYYADMPANSLSGFEIGNEPDDYGNAAYPALYYTQLGQWIAGIRSVTNSSEGFLFPSCGAFACGLTWNTPAIAFVNRGSATAFNTEHYYAAANTVSSGYLLTPAAYADIPFIGGQVQMMHRAGNKARIDEMNSNYGGGAAGVSDAFESALWMLDNLLSFAAYGTDGVNVEGCWNSTSTAICNYYDPATIEITSGTPNTFTLVQVWPVYYGMQAFQEALGAGNAKLYPVTVTAGTSSSVSAWDLIDSTGAERAVVINLDTTNSGNVNFTPTATYSSATCYTLTAPLYSSTTGVTIHGQTYDSSTDGTILGTYTTSTLTPTAGVFSIPLAVTQAQICKFNP